MDTKNEAALETAVNVEQLSYPSAGEAAGQIRRLVSESDRRLQLLRELLSVAEYARAQEIGAPTDSVLPDMDKLIERLQRELDGSPQLLSGARTTKCTHSIPMCCVMAVLEKVDRTEGKR